MGDYTERFSEGVELLQKIDPISVSVQTNGAAYVPIAKFYRLVAKFNTGVITATGTVTFRVAQAQDAAGTGAKVLKTDVGLVATTDNNKARWIEILGEEFDIANKFAFARLEIVAATAAGVYYAELLGYTERFQPAVINAALTVVP